MEVLADIATCKGTIVNLRVEGRDNTLFENTLSTCGHRVTTTSGNKYHCNGTNNDRNPCTGPTCTTALDDSKIGFDGRVPTTSEGGDEVLFALVDSSTTRYYLKLDGPTRASVNEAAVLTVTDGRTENPMEGAVISYGGRSYTSDALGRVSLLFDEAGRVQVKAQKAADSVRSNLFSIDSVADDDDDTNTEDLSAVIIRSPIFSSPTELHGVVARKARRWVTAPHRCRLGGLCVNVNIVNYWQRLMTYPDADEVAKASHLEPLYCPNQRPGAHVGLCEFEIPNDEEAPEGRPKSYKDWNSEWSFMLLWNLMARNTKEPSDIDTGTTRIPGVDEVWSREAMKVTYCGGFLDGARRSTGAAGMTGGGKYCVIPAPAMGGMEDKPKLRVMGAEKPQERGTHIVDAKDRKVPPSTQVGIRVAMRRFMATGVAPIEEQRSPVDQRWEVEWSTENITSIEKYYPPMGNATSVDLQPRLQDQGCAHRKAARTAVNLRVEGKTSTLFEGNVFTQVLESPKHCDGIATPCTRPTCTTALDDSRIDIDGSMTSPSRPLATIAGGLGCQQQVQRADNVLSALVSSTTVPFLKLSGPTRAVVNQAITLRCGTSVKAEKGGAIRSNRLLTEDLPVILGAHYQGRYNISVSRKLVLISASGGVQPVTDGLRPSKWPPTNTVSVKEA
ncbi:hypothetical protein BJV74DRAFT_797578 [Russula compacta]|nr:hypothetical protein BJV74DRAFT_797578 [Russula compacta]